MIIGNRPQDERKLNYDRTRSYGTGSASTQSILVDVVKRAVATQQSRTDDHPPTLYLLNAAALTKPHAIEHLGVDLEGYKVDIAVVTETHLTRKLCYRKDAARCALYIGYSTIIYVHYFVLI